MKKTHDHSRAAGKIFQKFLGLALLALAMTGCVRFSSAPPKAQVHSLQLNGSAPSGPVAVTVLQAQVMRFADTYAATIAEACDDVAANSTNSNLKLSALRWKLSQSSSAFEDATGQNPAVNALDILVLTTMARMVVQDYGMETYGVAVRPLLDAHRQMESNVWMLARGLLKPVQEEELKGLIQEWREKNPRQRYVGPIRFREFVNALGKTPPTSSATSTSLFSLLYLDPLAGLDPTAAAIEETRELGERAMYYGQRMPMLLSWQAEVLAYQLANQPGSQQVLNDASRLATSSEIFAQTAQQLPQLINDQRQAAIQQILDGLTEQGEKSRVLLADTRLTLDSASGAATNLNTAIQSLTEFVKFVERTNSMPSSATNHHPFNVLDYGAVAAQVGAAANNLNSLLTTMNQSTTQVQKLGQQTKADAEEIVRQAFFYGLLLVLVLLAGLLVTALFYRKLTRDGRK